MILALAVHQQFKQAKERIHGLEKKSFAIAKPKKREAMISEWTSLCTPMQQHYADPRREKKAEAESLVEQ